VPYQREVRGMGHLGETVHPSRENFIMEIATHDGRKQTDFLIGFIIAFNFSLDNTLLLYCLNLGWGANKSNSLTPF
jgi:hypothetical protein